MATILDSYTEMLSSDAVGQAGKAFGVSPDLVTKGMAIAGPLLTGAIARKTSTPTGMGNFTNLMNQTQSIPVTGGSGGMLSGILGGMNQGQGGTSADLMQGLLGNGVNAIGGTLSQKLGFDMRPILAVAAPMVIGAINKTMKNDNLDAPGVAQKLQTEHQAWMNDPANQSTVGVIREAEAAGQKGEDLRREYTDAEWEKVRMGPVAATYLVGAASHAKGAEAMKELAAATSSVDETINSVSPTSLIGTAFGGGLTKAELDGISQANPTTESVLKTISDAHAIVASKSPGNVNEYDQMVMNVATNVANATREGGFLGIGGTQVTKEEQAAIDSIQTALHT